MFQQLKNLNILKENESIKCFVTVQSIFTIRSASFKVLIKISELSRESAHVALKGWGMTLVLGGSRPGHPLREIFEKRCYLVHSERSNIINLKINNFRDNKSTTTKIFGIFCLRSIQMCM